MASRHELLQMLQPLLEVDEFLNLVGHPKKLEDSKDLRLLLERWNSRWPSPKIDEVWIEASISVFVFIWTLGERVGGADDAEVLLAARDWRKLQRQLEQKGPLSFISHFH